MNDIIKYRKMKCFIKNSTTHVKIASQILFSKILLNYYERIKIMESKWNLKDIFKNENEFSTTKNQLEIKLNEISKLKGKLIENVDNLNEGYKLYEEINALLEKIYSYGMLNYHLNMANQASIKLFKEVQNINTKVNETTSFLSPETTNLTKEDFKMFLNQKVELGKYKRIIENILDKKEHILPNEQEELLSNFDETFSSTRNIYDTLVNTELKFGELIDENGKKQILTSTNYIIFLNSKNRATRKKAFDIMYVKYGSLNNTIGEILLSKIKQTATLAKVKNYKSALHSALEKDESSQKVYDTLIETITQNINVNHDFINLKKKALKLDELHLYDIFFNPFNMQEKTIQLTEAKEMIFNALSILGDDYIKILQKAFTENWIDLLPSENKRSGAYSMGVYGVHPFILANFVKNENSVSTLAHELGHSIHSYFSNSNQNILDSNYTIMVAEVASTVNELLLIDYKINHEQDIKRKASLIFDFLEMLRSTFFRQAMFAEFEKEIYNKIEVGQFLSSEDLNSIYFKLNKKYFGDKIILDEKISFEWERIPHFYTPFYVYKYSTGISAAVTIASNILKDKNGYKEKYINMLKLGRTKKSLDLLKTVDVDLESNKPYLEVINLYSENVKKLEYLINEIL